METLGFLLLFPLLWVLLMLALSTDARIHKSKWQDSHIFNHGHRGPYYSNTDGKEGTGARAQGTDFGGF